ncbi:metal ABC transporter permease [Pseudoclavibacter sp. 13-3]|uniref:metal ABC transporter permease n=1 Tax=Pseudoclavibacter sp. 13-3 TaxID=2901228 RepID=UPI001E2F6F9C|nr:metal ABC transporter permease [Pseudoclavibacter sp. 13-3]MCD7101364.1 metal ABC transporter permease [Pseudoclavibacter sp. 13-3]
MSLIAPFLQYDFMMRALFAFVVLAVLAAAIGPFVALRDLEFVSDGLVHAVFPGLAIGALAFGRDGALAGAIVAGALAAAVLTLTATRIRQADAPVAVVLTTAFSIGVIAVSASGFPGQLELLLFGQMFAIRPAQIWSIAVVASVAVIAMLVTRRGQLYRAFDPAGARAAGFRPIVTDLVLNMSLAVAVVAGSQVLGNLLVLALLIIPAASARNFGAGIIGMVVLSGAFTLVSGWVGLAVAFEASVGRGVNLSPSGSVVGAFIVVYLASLIVGAVRRAGLHRSRRGSAS